MKTTLSIFTLMAVAFTGYAFAGPLQLNQVPSDIRALVHFDAEAFRATQMGQFFNDLMEDEPEAMQKLDEMTQFLGFDIREDLHSVTIYADGKAEKGDGVVIIDGEFDGDRLVELGGENDTFESYVDGGTQLHKWEDHGKQVFGYISDDGSTMVLGDAEDQIKRAVATLAGGPSLANANPNNVPVSAGGTFMFVGATGFADMPGLRAQAAMLRQAESLTMTISEKGGQMESLMKLATSDEDSAESMTMIANGMLQMIKGHADRDPVAKRLMKSFDVDQVGDCVEATFSHPTQDLIGIMEDQMDKMKEWKDGGKDRRGKGGKGWEGKKRGGDFEL